MKYSYKPTGVCASRMDFEIENNIIKNMRTIGGCPGNSLGIRSLSIGNDIDYVIDKLKGIKCGFRDTSCPDQITKALEQYKKEGN